MAQKSPQLCAWRICAESDPSQAPETLGGFLVGRVYGHPTISDGLEIKTSPVKSVNFKDRIAITTTGTVYELMDPSPDYVEWLNEKGHGVIRLAH